MTRREVLGAVLPVLVTGVLALILWTETYISATLIAVVCVAVLLGLWWLIAGRYYYQTTEPPVGVSLCVVCSQRPAIMQVGNFHVCDQTECFDAALDADLTLRVS